MGRGNPALFLWLVFAWVFAAKFVAAGRHLSYCFNWSEREDLNLRPPVPQTGALTRLRYAPIEMPLLHGSAAGVNHQSGHKSRLS